MPTEHHKI